MKNLISLKEIAHHRSNQTSYHLASEDYFRIQVFNLSESEILGPWKYDGNVLITIIVGTVDALIGDYQPERAIEFCQIYTLPGQIFEVIAKASPAAIQIIWTPPFAKIEDINKLE